MIRTAATRMILVLAIIAFSLVLLFTGKGHTLLLDNKAMTIGGVDHQPLTVVTVSVDGKKPVTLRAGERDLVQVKGVGHTITVQADGTEVTRKFSLPFEDMFLSSMPALVTGTEVWFEVKRAERATPVPDAKEEAPVGGESIPL